MKIQCLKYMGGADSLTARFLQSDDGMRIACLGGGPGGLYFAISMKLRDPDVDVVVYERNRPDDTFGWGVVLSDQTLGNLAGNDPASAATIREHFAYWDDVAIVLGGERVVSGGHGFCGIGRMRLLLILQARARELGVDLRFATEVGGVEELRADHDVVVACDGLNSRTRTTYESVFRPLTDVRACRFTWLGTTQKFDDAFTFIFERTEHGWVWVHAYQFDDSTATFIVECSEATYAAFGFDRMSQQQSIEVCQAIFRDHLGGHPLMTNAGHVRGSAWINFPRVICERWSHGNVVLLGDAAATAHFSIGSGTKLALESAISLAELLHTEASLEAAFARYESDRRAQVLRIQSAALNSLEWFENIERYLDFDPVQLNYAQLTRSQRIGHENLRLRDPDWLREAEAWFQAQAGAAEDAPVRAPMFAPLALGGVTLVNRVAVAPVSQYRAHEGRAGDWHLVHYAERCKGGAGLVVTEALAVLPEGRETPRDAGLWDDGQVETWRRVVDFAHAESEALVCAQLGHAGPRGAVEAPDGDGRRVALSDGWPLAAASAVAWGERFAVPGALDEPGMRAIASRFADAACRARAAGFDMVELHAGAGTLLASFLSPATNRRDDAYGGSAANRLRFPLAVVEAVRAVWSGPLALRYTAEDWLGSEGLSAADAVGHARAFDAAGIDLHVIVTGETLASSRPAYGRMYQVPMSDRVRNEAHVRTMAVGEIHEADHANSILLAGRADLVGLARPHLVDPYWTNRQAAAIGDARQRWPAPYVPGAAQLARLAGRGAA